MTAAQRSDWQELQRRGWNEFAHVCREDARVERFQSDHLVIDPTTGKPAKVDGYYVIERGTARVSYIAAIRSDVEATMAQTHRRLLDDAAWLASIGCEGVRGVRDPHGADCPSPSLMAVLRASSARRAAVRAEARRRGDKVADIQS